MAYYRKLPSGLWQATVRGRDGKRHTKTDKLKAVVKQWATEQEAAIARGDFRDPRLGDINVGDWHRRVAAARTTDPVTKAKHASLWATHCEPQWAGWQMAAITRMEAQEWANRLQATRRARHKGKTVTSGDQDVPRLGAETVCAAVHLMSQLYDVAMKETPPIVMVNPFAGLDLPEIRPHGIDFLERDEAEALYDAAGEFGARWRTLIELGTEVGLRPGEAVRAERPPSGLATRQGPGHRRNDPLRPAAMAEIQEVPPRRARSRAHPRGHVRADDRTAA